MQPEPEVGYRAEHQRLRTSTGDGNALPAFCRSLTEKRLVLG